MKELLTVTANFYSAWAEDEDKNQQLIPQVELIIVMSEPVYSVDSSGSTIRQREVSQCRFSTSPDMLRRLAESLVKLADESDCLANTKLSGSEGAKD
jgi:hypothetical protein